MLVMEYDNKKALIYVHIHSFASLPMSKSESGIESKKLRDIVSFALIALVESRISRQLVRPSPSIYYLREISKNERNGI